MYEITYCGITYAFPSFEEAEKNANEIFKSDGVIVGIVYISGKVSFDEFYKWRNHWYANRKCGARIGQDFCNHFQQNVGRGEHTRQLFYSVDDLYSEQIIYTKFIDWP